MFRTKKKIIQGKEESGTYESRIQKFRFVLVFIITYYLILISVKSNRVVI